MQSQNEITVFLFYSLLKKQSLEEIKEIYKNSPICKNQKIDPTFRFFEIIRKVSFENELAKFAKKNAFLIVNADHECSVMQNFKEKAQAYLNQIKDFNFIGTS